MSDAILNYQVIHQAQQDQFFVLLDDGQRAYLKYRRTGSETTTEAVDFYSTFVPNSARGKGLAAKLVEHGFAWAADNNLHITTSCWYAERKLAQQT